MGDIAILHRITETKKPRADNLRAGLLDFWTHKRVTKIKSLTQVFDFNVIYLLTVQSIIGATEKRLDTVFRGVAGFEPDSMVFFLCPLLSVFGCFCTF